MAITKQDLEVRAGERRPKADTVRSGADWHQRREEKRSERTFTHEALAMALSAMGAKARE